jgi:hypothetical protein
VSLLDEEHYDPGFLQFLASLVEKGRSPVLGATDK